MAGVQLQVTGAAAVQVWPWQRGWPTLVTQSRVKRMQARGHERCLRGGGSGHGHGVSQSGLAWLRSRLPSGVQGPCIVRPLPHPDRGY